MRLNIIYLFSVCAILIMFQSCKKDENRKKTDTLLTEKFQNVLDSIYKEHPKSVGILAHIEIPKKNVSWSGAIGFSNKNKDSLYVNQPVMIASITKTYVAATILRMVEEELISLNDYISKYLSSRTINMLEDDGYDTSTISIKQLLNHTSGIYDYASTNEYMELLKNDLKHKWTRNEQLQLAMKLGNPLGESGEVFAYADTNYLLLTEIMEEVFKRPFYLVIRELLRYKDLDLNATWFIDLEEHPAKVKKLANQYVTSFGFNSFEIDPSFDLFGGGGIASSTKDLASFIQYLFNHKVYKFSETLDVMTEAAEPKQPMESMYSLGLSGSDVNGFKAYGHGGFWGTVVKYFPDLDATVAIFVLERDKRILRVDLNKALVKLISEN